MSDDVQAQVDEQLTAQAEDVPASAALEMAKGLNCMMPGIIDSYDPEKQTAVVQPAIMRKFVGSDPEKLPLLLDVPVVFPAGGNHVLTFPITKGDECVVWFADRAIDRWWSSGGVQLPSEIRFHDLSDGFAFVGISSTPRMMTPALSTTATELRSRDGALVLRFENGLISAGVKNVQPAVVGTDLKGKLSALCQALAALTVPTGMGPSGTPINGATFSQIDSQLDEILSKSVVIQKNG